MNNQQHFDRSVAVLVKAFFEGVLSATNCAACACGNLVAAANGYSIVGHDYIRGLAWGPDTEWYYTTAYTRNGGKGVLTIEGLRQIESTGYTPADFVRIEDAFMDAADKSTENFVGLMAVVDVLADIHGIDLAAAETAKLLFAHADAA